MKLIAKAKIQIQKPVGDVFSAIVDPSKMSNYFISKGSGILESGKDVTWEFPEFSGEFRVWNVNVRQDELISFVWDPETVVNIRLTPSENDTIVEVLEDGKELNEKNLEWLTGNTEGWANFLACLKAYVEHGINLRKGAFDFIGK